MKKLFKTLAVSLATTAAATALLAGCGSGSFTTEYEYDYTVSDKKITYTFYGANQAFNKKKGDTVIEAVEKKFNVTINLQYASANDWRKQLSTLVNSDSEVPDMFFGVPDESYFSDWVDKGLIVPYNGYADKLAEDTGTSNLKNIFQAEQLKYTAVINGTNYFVPQVVDISNHFLVVRKDWMDQWAKAREKTDFDPYASMSISEFTDMLRYFQNGDPDGNGKADTFGLGLSKNFDFTEGFLSAFGVSPSYTLNEDGSYTLSAFTDGYDKFVDWLSAGNKDTGTDQENGGYILRSFNTYQESDVKSRFEGGSIGAIVMTGNFSYTNSVVTVAKNLDAELISIPFPSSDDGQYVGSPVGDSFYYGGWCISKNAKEPYRLVQILDYIFGEEGQDLFSWGIKDEHYVVNESGEKELTEETLKARFEAPASMFQNRDPVNDKKGNNGPYALGMNLYPAYFKVVDGKLVINNPYALYLNGGEAQKRHDEYMKKLYDDGTANYRQPRFLLSDTEMSEISIACLDYAKNYTLEVVGGTSKSKAKANCETQCKSKRISKLYKYMQEQNKGIYGNVK